MAFLKTRLCSVLALLKFGLFYDKAQVLIDFSFD